jgi:hypothetical protein
MAYFNAWISFGEASSLGKNDHLQFEPVSEFTYSLGLISSLLKAFPRRSPEHVSSANFEEKLTLKCSFFQQILVGRAGSVVEPFRSILDMRREPMTFRFQCLPGET